MSNQWCNQWCDTCGGLVDRIGLQPQGVRFCECRETIKKLRAKLADAKEWGKQLAEAQNCIQILEKDLAAERAEVERLRGAGEAALRTLENVRVFVTSKERIHRPSGEEWFEQRIGELRAALEAER